jgi:hypothetical protein
MIVCRKCRANNGDADAFCGSCGAFLEWTGEKVTPSAPPAQSEPEPSAEPDPPARPGLMERVQHAVTAVIAPAPAREDPGTTWTGFGASHAGGGPGGQPATKSAAAKSGPAAKPATGAADGTAPTGAEPTPAKKAAAAPKPSPAPSPVPPSAASPQSAPPPQAPPTPGNAVATPAQTTSATAEFSPSAIVEDSATKQEAAPAAEQPGATASPAPTSSSPLEQPPDRAQLAEAVADPPNRALADPGAAPLVAKVGDSATAETAPPPAEGVLPQRVPGRLAPVTRTKSTRRLQPGDLVCGQCGQGNPPTRKFCSRCGEPLTTAEVVRARWYRRLTFWRRGPKTLEAGARAGQKGTPSSRRASLGQAYRRVRNAIAGVMLLASLVYVVVPPLRTPVNHVLEPPIGGAKDWVSRTWHKLTATTVTLPPSKVRASAELRGHPAQAAFDDNTNSFWAARWSKKDPPSLTVHYDTAADLVAYAIHAGAPGEDGAHFLHPRQLVIEYGSGRTDTIELTPSGDAQTGSLHQATSFRFARITITMVYAEDGLKNVALSEIELKERRD